MSQATCERLKRLCPQSVQSNVNIHERGDSMTLADNKNGMQVLKL